MNILCKLFNANNNIALLSGNQPGKGYTNNQLVNELVRLGYTVNVDYFLVQGVWQGEAEDSLLLKDIPEYKLKLLAQHFQQDAYVLMLTDLNPAIIYTDSNTVKWIDNLTLTTVKPGDDYTYIPGIGYLVLS